MRKIAVVGSGQTGLLAAHALLKAGHEVTLYSDRTADQWLTEARPTGTAVRFDRALGFERELGLNCWDDEAPRHEAVHFTAYPAPGKRLITLTGRLEGPSMAVDLRLQSHRWMNELEARGGTIVVEPVTVPRLDEIAGENELTIVAAGNADLCRLFERDAERSGDLVAPRKLAMACFKGPPLAFGGAPLLPTIDIFVGMGEAFWMPYHHKDVGPSWNVLLEAVPGGPIDRFNGAKSGDEVVAIAKEIVREFVPWNYEWIKDAELSDRNGWLLGEVVQTVRKPVGRLPSGRVVTPLGDTAMRIDPVGGQGANNGNKMARNLAERVAAHGDRPFDEAWMTATFERFYRRHGGPSVKFNNLLLGPLPRGVMELLIAQYGSDGRDDPASGKQALANLFASNFNDPARHTDTMTDLEAMRALIERTTGKPWPLALAAGGLGVGVAQVRDRLGLPRSSPYVRPSFEGARAAGAAG